MAKRGRARRRPRFVAGPILATGKAKFWNGICHFQEVARTQLDSYLYICCFLSMGRSRRPSKQMLKLLMAMAASPGEWRHGYELMTQTGLLSGTLYPLLMRMTDQGLVEAEWREPTHPGRPPRHVYRLTDAGISFAREAAGSMAPGTRVSLA
jgi:hypothetical protein